jgi:hypothetical protein
MSDAELFHGRRASVLENDALRVVVLEGGGHIASVLDKASGVSPLWVPPWPSIEPAAYGPEVHPIYGDGADGRLLAGIMGHNLCLDIFGGPSPEEAAAGLTAHGEGSVVRYDLAVTAHRLTARAEFPLAQLQFERTLDLVERTVRVRETVANVGGTDRPVGWTQHVTLGPPFLERGRTEFRASAMKSAVLGATFGVADYLKAGARFDWPDAPGIDGKTVDLRSYGDRASSSAYTAHLMDQARADAFFVAFSPTARLAFGYVWKTADFPWMGIWEENCSRTHAPWNGVTLTRGMEFGVSPFPEPRRAMVERGRLFDVPTFRWIPARTAVGVDYWIVCRPADRVPETLERPS